MQVAALYSAHDRSKAAFLEDRHRPELGVGRGTSRDGALVLVGSQFDRLPADATRHYTAWANNLTEAGLSTQRFRECTVIKLIIGLY